MAKILRAALYERVSTDEQALKGYSIEAQKDNLEEYCTRQNIKVVGHYTDEGISGAKPPLKRPNLKRLLDDVEAGMIDLILFTKLDRWFRSVKEYFKVQEILDKYNVKWKAIHEDYDTSSANGQMAVTIFLAVAQNERDRTSERIKVVLAHKTKNKEACFGGAVPPIGYKKQLDEHGIARLVKDPETQQAVQDFWDIMVKYNNASKAIRHVQNVYGITKEWKAWYRIYHRDFYCGVHNGIQDYCEPYVSVEDWNRIQETHPVKASTKNRIYLFRGLVHCPTCGEILGGTTDKRNRKEYRSYRCANREKSCPKPYTISELKLESMLLDNLEIYVKDEIASVEIEPSRPRNVADIAKLKERRRRLSVVYMAGNITDAEYLKEDGELKLAIEQAEASQEEASRDLSSLKELLETDFRSLYYSLNMEEKQRFWHQLIKEIVMEDRTIKEVHFF